MQAVHIWQQPYNGWEHCIWMENARIRLIVTVDVGPRIICFQAIDGENLLHQFSEQQGSVNAPEWIHYGGHRLWHAPQVGDRPNQPDNKPVAWHVDGETLVLDVPMEQRTLVKKRMEITLAGDAPRVLIRHILRNCGLWLIELAPWALTMMHSGGLEVFPVPRLDTHYLPNYAVSFWPWTCPDDPRFLWGERYFMLRHDPANTRWFKIGYRNTEGWGAYFYAGCMFLKFAPELPGKTYPDYGATFETYADERFIELESLGPLVRLEPDASISHDETWFLFPDVPAPVCEADIQSRIEPIVQEAMGRGAQEGAPFHPC